MQNATSTSHNAMNADGKWKDVVQMRANLILASANMTEQGTM